MTTGNAHNQMALIRAVPADACLTVDEMTAVVTMDRRVIVKTASSLVTRGLLERVERGCFRLTADGRRVVESGEPLSSGPQGSHTGPRTPRRTTLRTRLWRAMRTTGKFTIGDLLTAASRGTEKRPENNAQRYVLRLQEAGYLHRLPTRRKGTAVTSNGFCRWALILDTGPEAPMLRRTANGWEVFDPNTGEVRPCER
jgi:hypothetical protein